jgi:hypothetical protein
MLPVVYESGLCLSLYEAVCVYPRYASEAWQRVQQAGVVGFRVQGASSYQIRHLAT